MASRLIRRLSAAVLVVCIGALGLFGTAYAGAGDQYQKQAEHFQTRLEKQAKKDSEGIADKDRKLTQKWLKNAEVLLANGDVDAAGRLLKRVKASLDLMDAMIAASNIEAQAEKQEQQFHKLKEKTIPELEAKIEELKDEKKKLRDELRDLQS